MHDRLHLKGMCSGSRDLLSFWKYMMSESVQETHIVAMED